MCEKAFGILGHCVFEGEILLEIQNLLSCRSILVTCSKFLLLSHVLYSDQRGRCMIQMLKNAAL